MIEAVQVDLRTNPQGKQPQASGKSEVDQNKVISVSEEIEEPAANQVMA